ncbi:MAG TPA: SGNH/GDSL hydrolase family protein [Polyangiaceae bacterium]|nr:SGNH/GDSL hydrolase family protein [Polyangiaceae bacterium]
MTTASGRHGLGLVATLEEIWWRSLLRRQLRLGFRLIRSALPDPDGLPVEDEPLPPLDETPLGIRLGLTALLVVLSVLVAIVVFEIVVRIPGVPIPRDLSTHLFQCYGPEDESSRVAFGSPELDMGLLKPDFDAGCGYNGYRWHHHTDHYGFRNPETWERTDVVLLGDSMIYGHGVEETQTAAHFMRERLGARVTNLAFMGDTTFEELAILSNFGLPLHPKVAIVYVFNNDLEDIEKGRDDPRIRRFIETGEAPEARLLPREEILRPGRNPPPSPWPVRLAQRFLSYRTLRYYLDQPEVSFAQGWHPFSAYPLLPSAPVPPPEPRGRDALALEYMRKAFSVMKERCDAAGTTLVIAHLPGLNEEDGYNDRLLYYHAQQIAADLGVPFLDAAGALVDDAGNRLRAARLVYDGHLTEFGHRRLADLTSDFLVSRGLLRR